MSEQRRGGWFQTYTGRQFWPCDPRPAEISLVDIAHHLALQCRFMGSVREFYSVAQHSVLCSLHVPAEDAVWGLLHDASEAYLHDLISPLKHGSPIGRPYRNLEARLMAVICEVYGLAPEMPASVREVDGRLLMTEARDLMAPAPAVWEESGEPLAERIVPWLWMDAEHRFMQRAEELGLISSLWRCR